MSIAAVQGHAIGAGFQLALACDLRVVADDVQFAMRETSLGLVPDLAGTHPLVELVGYARALEICATGRFVHAEEARATGLANLVVPADELDGAVNDLAAALLAAPRDAVIETKALLRGAVAVRTTSSAPPSAPPRPAGCATWRAWGTSRSGAGETLEPAAGLRPVKAGIACGGPGRSRQVAPARQKRSRRRCGGGRCRSSRGRAGTARPGAPGTPGLLDADPDRFAGPVRRGGPARSGLTPARPVARPSRVLSG